MPNIKSRDVLRSRCSSVRVPAKSAEHIARSVDRLGLGPGSGYVIPGPRQTLLLSMSFSSSSQFVLAYSEKKIECHRTGAPYGWCAFSAGPYMPLVEDHRCSLVILTTEGYKRLESR